MKAPQIKQLPAECGDALTGRMFFHGRKPFVQGDVLNSADGKPAVVVFCRCPRLKDYVEQYQLDGPAQEALMARLREDSGLDVTIPGTDNITVMYWARLAAPINFEELLS